MRTAVVHRSVLRTVAPARVAPAGAAPVIGAQADRVLAPEVRGRPTATGIAMIALPRGRPTGIGMIAPDRGRRIEVQVPRAGPAMAAIASGRRCGMDRQRVAGVIPTIARAAGRPVATGVAARDGAGVLAAGMAMIRIAGRTATVAGRPTTDADTVRSSDITIITATTTDPRLALVITATTTDPRLALVITATTIMVPPSAGTGAVRGALPAASAITTTTVARLTAITTARPVAADMGPPPGLDITTRTGVAPASARVAVRGPTLVGRETTAGPGGRANNHAPVPATGAAAQTVGRNREVPRDRPTRRGRRARHAAAAAAARAPATWIAAWSNSSAR